MPINLQPSTATATATAGIIKKERTRGEGSRRMPNNSRPPLSHRIRASFEGKKSQDSTSPKHASFSGSSPTDPEVLRQAIDYAISGDAFQAGIASHIAKMLKPQIKTALDTIEPLVNAVLQHEILLKKTNASVENVLLRLDTMTDEDGAVDPTKARLSTPGALSSHPISERKLEDATLPISSTSTPDIPGSAASEQPIPLLNRNVTYTVGKLSEISDSLDLNNNKLGKVVEGIAQLNDLLLSNERLDSLKESSEKNATNTSVMQAQLDQLQENVRVIITRIGSDLGTNVKAINDRLAEGIPGSEKAVVAPGSNEEDAQLLRAISSELEVLKGNLDAGTSSHNENLASLKMQISALQSTLDDQKVLLGEIKEADNSVDILAGIQKSNESHEAHTAILGELKERNAEPVDASTQPIPASGDAETLQTILAEVQKSNEAHEKHEAALAGIKDSETSAAILAEVQKSNESHTSHAAALETLKSSPTPPPEPTTSIDLEGLETKMGSLIETSTSILAEVQKSNESHVSHAAALESIKALPTPPPESTPASASVDLEGLEKNMGSIIEKLDNHAAVLDEIKTKELSVSGGIDSTAFDGHFGSINTLLDAHTAALDELKAKDSPIADFGPIILLLESHTAILDEIKAKDLPITDLTPITSMLESHTAALDELKARDLPITDFAPVTSILESHNAILDEIKAKDLPITDLAPITSMLEAHTATLDEIKAKDGASNIDFGPITSILESHSAVLDEIKTKDGASNIDFNPITSILESHTSALEELKSKDIPTADFTPVTSLLEAHSAILEDIKAKDVAPAIDFGPITSTLESHSAALDEIKSKDVQSSAEPASINMEAFDTHFGAITGMLAAHTAALDEIKSKDNSSDSSVPVEINTEALDKHFGSITSMLEAHTATLDEMKSKDVTASTGPTEFNTAVFDGHFNSLTSLLESHTAALDEIKSKNNDFSQPSTEARNCTGFEVFEPHITAMKSALDAQMVVLDGLKSEALAKNDMDATVVDNMLEPHILAIKSTLDGHTAILEELKSKIYSDNASPPETTNDSLPTILQTLSSHTNLLTEIKNADVSDEILTALHELQESNSTAFNTLKESDVSDEILTALHTCNDSQEKLDKSLLELQTTLNTSSLSEQSGEESIQPIEEIPGPASGVNINGLETQISAVIATLEGQSVVLEEIKNAANGGMEAHSLHTTTLSEIKDAANASNESHNTHTATLEVIRDATAALSNAHSTQVNMLNELKEALNTSNESHNTHASTLGEIRDATASSNEAHTSHTSTLAELKEAINSSVESHASHTAALADLKSLQSAQPSPDTIVDTKSAPILDTSGLDTQLTTIITALESQTSTLGEIKEVHTSHTTILDEIKDATIASNESHISHTTILSEIKELTAPVHGINEVLSTHTSFLEGLKDGSGSKHDEVRGDIESLKKIIEESSGKHEENLLKHGELIKEHGELVKENHDGLKGTIAGLAIGGIVGAGVIKAVGGNEEGTPSSVDKEVPEETIETGPETQTEEKEVPVEELTPVENEAPVEEESASDTKEMEPEALAEEEETPVIEESSIAPEDIEAPQEPEVSVEEEKAIEEEKPVDEVDIEQDPEPEVMPTEPDVVAEPKEEVSTPDPVENEPASEPEAVVEEAPVEELASSEPEKPVEEAVTEDSTPKEEEKDAEPPTIETDETPSVEPQEAEGGGAAEETISQDRSVSVEPDVPSEPEPNPEDNAPASNAEPVVAETSEDTEIPTEEIVEEPTPVQATNPEEDLQIVEESEVNEKVEDSTPEIVEEPISNQDTTDMEETPVPEEEATPGEDNVPESSNDQPEPEESAVTEEVPVEKEVAEDEGPKEETDGESKEDKVHGDGEIVDGDEPKSAEEAAPVVVEEENPIEEIIQDTEEKELRLNDEENSTEEAVPEVLIENPAVTSEETLPLETDEAPAASEEAKVPNSDENSLESEENTILPDQADSVISEPSHSVSTEHVDSATEHKVTESISEDPQVCVEADSEKPIEIEEKSLETGTKDPSDEDISSDAIENPIEPLQKEDIPEPNVESETSIPELSDPSQLPEESKDKDLDNEEELNEPLHNENIPEQIVETAVPVSLLADQEQTPTECEGNSQIGENSNEDVSNETAESVIEPSTEDTPPETVAETETSPELNNQDQTPIESEEKSLEPPQVNEYDTDKIPKIIDEKSIETLEEEVSTEPTIETESPISSELKDEENSIKDEISEPAVLGLESSEQHPSADSEDKSKSLEMQIEEPSNDTQPSKSEENTVEPHEENSPEPPIKTETPVFASDDQEQPPVKNEESTLDLELNTPIVQELEVSEEQPSWSTNSEEQITDITPQEIMQVSVVEDESSTSVPESTEEILSTVKDEELPELTDERAIDISNDEPSTESKPSNPLEEDHIVIIKPENITAELDDKNENPTEIPESIDEDQVIIDDKEKPTSANEELTETPIEEKVGSESLAPKPDIGEDPEDVKAREEIAILNAEMANILADEEIKSSEPMAEDATKSEGDNCIVEAETISGDEPKALEVEQIIEKPIDVTDEQTPVENPETLEEQHEDEPIYTEVIELKEEQADSVIGDELSSELEVKESLEEPPLRSITSEETSQEEPEAAVFESSIPKPTENPLSQEEITPIITEEVAESHAQVSENEILPEEKSEELFAELQESLDSILQETAGHTAMKDLSNESAFSQAEDLPEEEIQVKEAAPLPLESSVETEGNEDLHLRLEAAMDTEPQASEDKTIPEEPTMECESKVPERKRTDSPIQKVSGIESELTVESPELVEVANQESDNGISPLEHIEDFEADSGPQDHVSDTDSVVINDSRAVEGEIVIENYSNPKELEIESMTESIFNEISSSGLVANNNAVEGSVRELENAEDIRLPELSHEEIPVIGELQWGSKPVHDDVDSEILLPSDLDQDEPVQFEEETGFISAQDSIQARSYQASEDIPSDREFLRKYSIIQNEDGIEHMSYSSSRDVPVLSENEFVRGRNMSGEPESVFDTKEVVNEEISENTPWDRIYQGHVESQIFPESQPQTQPIREYIPVVPESSQIYKTSVPTKGEPSIDRESSFMVSRNERVIGDSQDVSEDIPVGMNDEFMFGDNASVYSQEFVPEDYRKEQESPTLDRSFKPTTSASEYVSSERLERESESEPTRFYSREPYLHHENKSFEPEASSNRKYSTFAETRLDTRSSFNYQDDDEQFNLEQENTQFNSREFYPAHKTDLSKPASPLEQRYSSYEEFPPEIRSTLNYQDDEQSDPEPETRHTDTSYSYDQFSKSFSSEETQVNNYEPEPEHPVTPTDQMTYEDNIPPTPPTALSRQISTERFPAYDESRRSPISHGFNLGLPIRNPERVETIPESPQFEHENRYPYNMREIPDFDDERPYPKYDNPARSSRSPQPLDFGLSRRIPVPADTTRQSSAFDNEPTYPGCEELGHPSRSSQGFNFGVSARNIAPVDYQREAREWVHERGKVKNLLRQFEGGESVADAPVPPPHERISTASPYDRLGTAIPQPQDHFGTAIPRPLDTRSFGKQPAYEEESRVAVPFDRRSEFRGGESSMGQRSLQGEFGLGRGEGSSFASPSGWEFGLGGEGRRGDEDGGDRAGYGGGYEYGYGDSSGVSKKGKSKKEKEKRRSGGGGNMY
ncbi:hypothetical protein EYC84_002812 [Monilinia fructicola]|uniref:Uncharacterized protein n=1 Tax=Monilinia fructicola TaxID=38448 RepID=A0A5M9JPH5_MONFR|nr:hypothetical protein EYC84_002812 [Monilinia fructicola]